MRVAVLCDIHGNLPALNAVLAEVASAGVERIVMGGDIVPGPMPRECLDRLLTTDVPVQFVHGNGERSVLAQMAALQGAPVTYWGTTSGNPLPEKDRQAMRWSALQLGPDDERLLAAWPRTLTLDVDGIGKVVFCHATPRSETEIVLKTTAEQKLLPIYETLGVALVVCGHTHMPYDRQIGSTRLVNPGSVGAPFGEPGAYWALLGPDVQLERTPYDLEQAAAAIRATSHPFADEQAQQILSPPAEKEMLDLFEPFAVK
jgi:predicted phosphodiesterase